jgi:hypothetical protein
MLKFLPSFSIDFSYACNIRTPPGQRRLERQQMLAGVVVAQIPPRRCRGQTDFGGRHVDSSRTESLKRIGS